MSQSIHVIRHSRRIGRESGAICSTSRSLVNLEGKQLVKLEVCRAPIQRVLDLNVKTKTRRQDHDTNPEKTKPTVSTLDQLAPCFLRCPLSWRRLQSFLTSCRTQFLFWHFPCSFCSRYVSSLLKPIPIHLFQGRFLSTSHGVSSHSICRANSVRRLQRRTTASRSWFGISNPLMTISTARFFSPLI